MWCLSTISRTRERTLWSTSTWRTTRFEQLRFTRAYPCAYRWKELTRRVKAHAANVRKALRVTAFCILNFVSPYGLKLMTGINKLIERRLLQCGSYFPVWKCRNYKPRCRMMELRKIIRYVQTCREITHIFIETILISRRSASSKTKSCRNTGI